MIVFFRKLRGVATAVDQIFRILVFAFLTLLNPKRARSNFPDLRNQKVLVLFNGPSLSQQIKSLKNTDYDQVVAVNAFASSPHFKVLKPTMYFIQDPDWFETENQGEKAKRTIEAIRRDLHWKMEVYVPAVYLRSQKVKELESHPLITIHPMYFHVDLSFIDILAPSTKIEQMHATVRKLISTLLRKGRLAIPTNAIASTVLYMLIMSRGERVIIFGLDMSMGADLRLDQGAPSLEPSHFYPSLETKIPPFAGPGSTMAENYRALADKFAVLYLLQDLAKENECKVVNQTSKTLLDAFLG